MNIKLFEYLYATEMHFNTVINNFEVCFRQEIPLFQIFYGYATRHSDA